MKKETITTTIRWTKGDKPTRYGEYLVYGKEIGGNKERHRVRIMNYSLFLDKNEWQDERGLRETGFVIEYHAPATIISPTDHVCESNLLPSLVHRCKTCSEVIR